jgi:hypothetical protein
MPHFLDRSAAALHPKSSGLPHRAGQRLTRIHNSRLFKERFDAYQCD